MINFLNIFNKTPVDFLEKIKEGNFKWTNEEYPLFHKWVNDKRSEPKDIPTSVILKGVSLNKSFWDIVEIWWTKYPDEFSSFWKLVKKNPRQLWSPSCLNAINSRLPVDQHKELVKIALLKEEGQHWILNHPDYCKELENINDADLKKWVQATVYSMEHLNKAFFTLNLLVKKSKVSPNRVAQFLGELWREMSLPDDNPNLIKKAWILSNKELDNWMDSDKNLPFWFDPVNESSWLVECKAWSLEVRWVAPENHWLHTPFSRIK